MTKPPDLLRIIADWWAASKWADSFSLVDNRLSCKCCNVIFIKIGSDRIYWGLYPRGHASYQKGEMMAADPKMFDTLTNVFENANHDRVRAN